MLFELIPKVIGSNSFPFDLSDDCICASWLDARDRETGCCNFIPEDTWASVSSKLDLQDDKASHF